MLISHNFLGIRRLLFAGFLAASSFSVQAVTMLTLPGSFQPPGIIGTFANDSQFSWIKHRFPANDYFSWRFGGGTDGGVIFDQPQEYTSMTDVFTMFNQPAGFYSVANGLTIDSNNTIDMSNIRMRHAGDVIDIGSGSGFDTLVPFLTDISLLGAGDNGWSIDTDGAYHLFYNTSGICVDCEMTIHFYGAAVPVPAAVWLFGSGLIGFVAIASRRRR